MGILNSEVHLIFYILFFILVMLVTVSFRYYREHDAIFWDASTYFVLLMCLYVAVPAVIHLDIGITLVDAEYETIIFSAQYSLYFISILTAYYFLKTLLSFVIRNHSPQDIRRPIHLLPISNSVVYGLYAVIVVYVLTVFFLQSPGIRVLWSDRTLANSFSEALNDTYKIQLMFAMTVSLVVFLTLQDKRKRHLFMLTPFIGLNLMTTDRAFMYQSLLVSIGVFLLTQTKIPIFKLIVISFFIVSIAVIRAIPYTDLDLDSFVMVPPEFLYTTEAGYVIIEAQRTVDFGALLIYSLGKIFTPQVMTALFGGVVHFREILKTESPVEVGLGGSMLSEVFSVKNDFLYVVYPFIVIVYLEIINVVRSHSTYFGTLVFIFYLTSTYAVFRGGVIFNAVDPLYYTLYAAGWYWIGSSTASRGSRATAQ